jgi:hypothetical protein
MDRCLAPRHAFSGKHQKGTARLQVIDGCGGVVGISCLTCCPQNSKILRMIFLFFHHPKTQTPKKATS